MHEMNTTNSPPLHNEKRLEILQNLLENFQHKSNQDFLGKYCEVLIENKLNNQDKFFGRTKYMTPVICKINNCKPGNLKNIKITSFSKKSLFSNEENSEIKVA